MLGSKIEKRKFKKKKFKMVSFINDKIMYVFLIYLYEKVFIF